MKTINAVKIETPLGEMYACATEKGICMLEFADDKKSIDKQMDAIGKYFGSQIVFGQQDKYLAELQKQLALYFAGKLTEFTFPLDMAGTEFQKKAWGVMRAIPYGKTISYKQEAESVGDPKAVRAVAGANGRNRIAIVIPCHRVIGSDGSLTGYSAGIERKKWLLELESRAK